MVLTSVHIDPVVHARIERAIHRPVEVGGTFKLSSPGGSRTLVLDQITNNGKFNSVPIPKGLVQFHTHPAECQNFVCTVGMPSIQDLIEFAKASMRGEALAHCIYSKDGTYCIQTRLSRVCRWNIQSCLEYARMQLRAMFVYYDPVTTVGDQYTRFRTEWAALASSHGIVTRFWPRGQVPRMNLDIPLSYLNT